MLSLDMVVMFRKSFILACLALLFIMMATYIPLRTAHGQDDVMPDATLKLLPDSKTNNPQKNNENANDSGDVDFNINTENIPDAYLFEYKNVLNQCYDTYPNRLYYDCQCYAMRFLEERIKRGETAAHNHIEIDIRKECIDAAGAAGFEYESCLKSYNSLKPGTDPEQFCTCYANKYVNLFEYYVPEIQSRPLVALRTRARIECSKEMRN